MLLPKNSFDQNGSRTAIMEAQFLLDIVNDTPYEKGPVHENISKNWSSGNLQIGLQNSPQWNLTILEKDPSKVSVGGYLNERKKGKDKKLKQKWKLRSDLPLESYFQSPEDWNDLFLMSKLSGGKCEPSDEDADTSSAESENDYDDDNYNSDQDNRIEHKYFDSLNGLKKHRPVEEMIKRKVIEVRRGERENLEFGNKNEITENMLTKSKDKIVKPEYENISEVVDETGKIAAPKRIYNFQKRKFEEEKREARNARRRVKKRAERMYEKQPFDDPVLEKRRLKAVKAKMINDKNRFDLENLKLDAKELADENIRLKQKLCDFQDREARHLKLLEEKKSMEIRNIELEKEVNMLRQRESNTHVEFKQILEPNYALLGVQVWWKLF